MKVSSFKFLIVLVCSILLNSCSKLNNEQLESFNKYDKVRLLSYSEHRKEFEKSDIIKLINDSINIPKVEIIDNVVLNNIERDKILKVLSSKDIENCSYADCYQPRHILLFYKKNKIIDFYEFCCACGGSRQSRGVKIPDICTQQGDELINIFKEMKLKNHGDEGVDGFKYF